MRHITLFCFVLFSAVFLVSCEKVIDINLKDAEKKYMIEGVITNHSGGCRVLITQTKNFDEDNSFPGVGGANVSITDNGTGTTSVLSETAPGVYEATSLAGVPGKTYTLQVEIEEKIFKASSSMPQPVNMDTIYVSDENMFGEIWKLANIEFRDPDGIENSYRFIQHINGVKTKQIFIRNDDLVDGKIFSTKLYMNPDMDDEKKLKKGDELEIEMQCIDQAVYKYWYSLDQSATGQSSVTPANPVSNIRGGALGYFSAHTTQSKTMTVE